MEKSLNWREFVITRLIQASGYSAIVFVALIFFFLIREGIPTVSEVKMDSLLNIRWYPIEEHFGILPLITGSLIITLGAARAARCTDWPRPPGRARAAARRQSPTR